MKRAGSGVSFPVMALNSRPEDPTNNPDPTGAAGVQDDLAPSRWAWALFAVTALAMLLRLYKLDEWAFWVDEGHTFRDATATTEVFWHSHVSKYPLCYLLSRSLMPWIPSVGEGWLRLPFVVFGILSVPLLAIVGKTIVGARAGLVGALFLAIHPWHLYWSQNYRTYPMVVFFGILAAGFGHRALRLRSMWYAAAAVFASLGAGLSHPHGFALLFVLIVFAVLAIRSSPTGLGKRSKQLLLFIAIGSAVGVAAMVPWIGEAIAYFQRAKSGSNVVHLGKTMVFFLRVVLIPTAVAGAWWVLRSRKPAVHRGGLLVATWAFLPPLLLVVATRLFGFRVTAQYALISLPAWCVLAGVASIACYDALYQAFTVAPAVRGGKSFYRLDALARRVVPSALALVVAFDFGAYDVLYFTTQFGDRPRWRDGAQLVETDAGQPFHVLTTNLPTLRYYLNQRSYWGETRADRGIESIEHWEIDASEDAASWLRKEFDEAVSAGRKLYIVHTEPEVREKGRECTPHADLDGLFRRHGEVVGRYPCWVGPKDMTVWVLRIDERPPEPVEQVDLPDGIEVVRPPR